MSRSSNDRNKQPRRNTTAIQRSALLAAMLLMVGCAPSLTAAGRAVKLQKNDPPEQCQEVGDLSASAVGYCYVSCQKTRIRNEAAELGANYVRYETVSGIEGTTGTAYKCPQ